MLGSPGAKPSFSIGIAQRVEDIGPADLDVADRPSGLSGDQVLKAGGVILMRVGEDEARRLRVIRAQEPEGRVDTGRRVTQAVYDEPCTARGANDDALTVAGAEHHHAETVIRQLCKLIQPAVPASQ
jgi:hypothetical protein